jgi:hypothetical protein
MLPRHAEEGMEVGGQRSHGGVVPEASAEAMRSAQLHRWYESFRPWTIRCVVVHFFLIVLTDDLNRLVDGWMGGWINRSGSPFDYHARTHTYTPLYRTEFIPLPPAFVQWLRADGPLVLPSSVTLSSTGKEDNVEGWEDGEVSQRRRPYPLFFFVMRHVSMDEKLTGLPPLPPIQPPSSTSSSSPPPHIDGGGAEPESFPELEAALTAAIEALGGAVCPKLNWSVPRDAAWVNGGTLRCETPGDVMLLLKSSDFVQHDLDLEQTCVRCLDVCMCASCV